MKKVWSNPVVEEMSIKETAAGGPLPHVHDGNIYEIQDENGETVAVEEYWPVSGDPNYER